MKSLRLLVAIPMAVVWLVATRGVCEAQRGSANLFSPQRLACDAAADECAVAVRFSNGRPIPHMRLRVPFVYPRPTT
jgi:hypothetical protein